MLKKSVFVLAIALLSVGAYARDYVTPTGSTVDWEYDGATSERKAESYNWPAAYLMQDICVIPVKMDVGFWIKVNGCKDLVMKLSQVEIHKYSGTLDISIVCNVNIKLEASFTKGTGMPSMGTDFCTVTPSTLDAPGGTVVLALKIKDVDLAGFTSAQVGTCIQIGTVTLKVRPNVNPQLAGGC
jgi:hypothetical protein